MDMYGHSHSTPDFFRIDDLLDFSNDEIFDNTELHPTSGNNNNTSLTSTNSYASFHTDFSTDICVPSDDVAELEWLSNFVDDSFSDFTVNNSYVTGTTNFKPDSQFQRSRSKRCRQISSSANTSWTSSSVEFEHVDKKENTMSERRCTHCASEKTPQWRTGPLGPKTLCNACGVRYKSGRLVPEYRPAASPTFVLTQHSNSHRKVMELRRQKQQQSPENHNYHHQNYQIC